MMRKLFLAAAAIVAMSLTGCIKDTYEPSVGEEKMVDLTIMISDGSQNTRATEAAGETDQLVANLVESRSYIFVFNALGNVVGTPTQLVKAEAIVNTPTNGAGQVVESVPANARVYVVANIPAFDVARITGYNTLDEVKKAVSDIETQNPSQATYKTVVLANVGGSEKVITVSGDTATVDVSIAPVVSRLELFAVRGGADGEGNRITAFTVAGVYIDNYFAQFAYDGKLVTGQTASTVNRSVPALASVPTYLKDDAAAFEADDTTGDLIAVPGNDVVWGYNLAPGDVPRIIVKLTGVEAQNGSGEALDSVDPAAEYYLTVTGYTGVTAFAPGKGYRIGGDADGLDLTTMLTFTPGNLHATPNPADVDLTVKVNVVDWDFGSYGATLAR